MSPPIKRSEWQKETKLSGLRSRKDGDQKTAFAKGLESGTL